MVPIVGCGTLTCHTGNLFNIFDGTFHGELLLQCHLCVAMVTQGGRERERETHTYTHTHTLSCIPPSDSSCLQRQRHVATRQHVGVPGLAPGHTVNKKTAGARGCVARHGNLDEFSLERHLPNNARMRPSLIHKHIAFRSRASFDWLSVSPNTDPDKRSQEL